MQLSKLSIVSYYKLQTLFACFTVFFCSKTQSKTPSTTTAPVMFPCSPLASTVFSHLSWLWYFFQNPHQLSCRISLNLGHIISMIRLRLYLYFFVCFLHEYTHLWCVSLSASYGEVNTSHINFDHLVKVVSAINLFFSPL